MIPVIALVGRPNVGKSTLFNRLTRSRDALVADYPGLTRDRKYGQAEIDGTKFIVIDTGGLEGNEQGIELQMAEQSLLAIEEADIVLFLVDGRSGLLAGDYAIAQCLRSREKKSFLVVNKTDGLDADSVMAEFYQLGMADIFAIAASHGRGVTSMMHGIFQHSPQHKPEDDNESVATLDKIIDDNEAEPENEQIKIALVGRPNVGKSTLTNRLLGEERVVVYDHPGTTRDSIYIPLQRDNREYILIDTAGVRRRAKIDETVEKFSVIKTLQAIEDANVALLLIDAQAGITDQDLSLLGFILESGRALVIAVNKWDGLNQEVKKSIKSTIDDRLGFVDFARIHFISALHGSGVGKLFDSIHEAFQCATQRTSTALLTRIMQMAQDEHQPPMVKGRRIKLKYAHAGGYNPPLIVIHGNQVSELPDSYQRYLRNYYRRALKIVGTPIKLQFNDGENPFHGRRNKLTPTQQRKRRRLITHLKKRKK